MSNKRFENALNLEPQNVPPIWFMRQAGRYHHHYQALRAKHSFMDLCKNPQLAAEVTCGPIADFDFDVAIIFSDLLFPLEAMGMGLEYTDQGPRLGWHLNQKNLADLNCVQESLSGLKFQAQAIETCRKQLPINKSLIGFIGGQWTLYTYAVEGVHKGSLTKVKSELDLFKSFCEKLTPLLVENIDLQIQAGAEVVMIFDTAAGELSPKIYHDLVLPELEKLIKAFPRKLAYYSKGTTLAHCNHPIYRSKNWLGRGFDHRFYLPEILEEFSSKGSNKNSKDGGFVQGNFDQALLFTPKEKFEQVALDYLEPLRELSPQKRRGWVCGLGHGVLPKTPEENVRQYIKLVRDVFA